MFICVFVNWNGVSCIDGDCCSSQGLCGKTPEHCQGTSSTTSSTSSTSTSSSQTSSATSSPVVGTPVPGRCGPNFGGSVCTIPGECCSKYGWCGKTPEHCQ